MRPSSRLFSLSTALLLVGLSLNGCGGGGGSGGAARGAGSDGGASAAPLPSGTMVGAGVEACALADLPAQALAEVNAARLQGHTCRGTAFPAVTALSWDNRLAQAAAVQAADMATHDYVDHSRQGGSTVGARIGAAGYTENVAGGPSTVAGVVAGWLASTKGHCENLMDARVSTVHMGLACYRRPGSRYTTYWALVTARPLP